MGRAPPQGRRARASPEPNTSSSSTPHKRTLLYMPMATALDTRTNRSTNQPLRGRVEPGGRQAGSGSRAGCCHGDGSEAGQARKGGAAATAANNPPSPVLLVRHVLQQPHHEFREAQAAVGRGHRYRRHVPVPRLPGALHLAEDCASSVGVEAKVGRGGGSSAAARRRQRAGRGTACSPRNTALKAVACSSAHCSPWPGGRAPPQAGSTRASGRGSPDRRPGCTAGREGRREGEEGNRGVEGGKRTDGGRPAQHAKLLLPRPIAQPSQSTDCCSLFLHSLSP